jgi:hypothetical protein
MQLVQVRLEQLVLQVLLLLVLQEQQVLQVQVLQVQVLQVQVLLKLLHSQWLKLKFRKRYRGMMQRMKVPMRDYVS